MAQAYSYFIGNGIEIARFIVTQCFIACSLGLIFINSFARPPDAPKAPNAPRYICIPTSDRELPPS